MNNSVGSLSLIFILILSSCSSILIETHLDTTTETTIAELMPRTIMLSGIETIVQPTSTTCGITAVAIVSNYYNTSPSSVEEVISRNNVDRTQGITTALLLQYLESELPSRDVEYFHDEDCSTLFQRVHASLNSGNPLVVLFGAPNPYNRPLNDFHTAVIYGIDLDQEIVMIANPYGYIEELSFVDFVNRMSFSELNKYSIIQQLIIRNNVIDKNMLFVIGNS